MSDELKKDVEDNLDTEEVLQDMEDVQEDQELLETAEPIAGSEEAQDGKEPESKADKKAAKKRLKNDKKQDALKEKIEELEDRVKRQMAEFDNFRKRTEKEKTAMFETGAKSVVEKILPVVDNFERGLATVPAEEKNSPFAEGMEMIYKQLISELEKMEVKPIPAVGEEFNPEFHNAVMQVESDEYESGVIAQELQKGYTYRDSVVRHSMVAVVS
ncbi:MAG: nucleotide exchange factor GrpE [Lachnospiraceae bacterium]|nr:nucleotide exchange factor GrpE [Lachnospiraceae bacterium]